MKRLFLLVSILVLQTAARAQNTLLWEISGNGLKENSYLFGTIHAICPDDVVMNDSIKAALKNTKRLVLEVDEKKAGALEQLRGLMMKGDSTLKDVLTEAEYTEVEAFFRDSLDMSLASLQRIQPFFLSAFPLIKCLPCKAKEIQSMEKVLRKKAGRRKKVDQLESFAYQSALIDSIPYKEQAQMLLEGIRTFTKQREQFNTLLADYKAGKVDAFHTTDSAYAMGAEFEARFLVMRNRNWVPLLKEKMADEPCFVAVGAAHLGGDEGIIALLRAQGYTVRPVFY